MRDVQAAALDRLPVPATYQAHAASTAAVPNAISPSPSWLSILRRFFAAMLAANLAWESVHLPLYTIWREGSAGEIAFAVLHCTGGDMLIASASLLGALLLTGEAEWPSKGYWRVGALATAAGVSYTIFSEWLNTEIRNSWAYTDLMPTLPIVGTGLSPVLQWIVIPLAALAWARHVQTPAP